MYDFTIYAFPEYLISRKRRLDQSNYRSILALQQWCVVCNGNVYSAHRLRALHIVGHLRQMLIWT